MLRALGHWELPPSLLTATVAGAVVLARGMRRRRLSPVRNLCCVAGVVLWVLALFSPVAAYADRVFSLHMAQHMLLVYAAALVLAAGHGGSAFLLGLPAGARGALLDRHVHLDAGTGLVGAAVAANVAMLGWHLPLAYQAALHNDTVHALEHLTLFATWYWLWAALLSRRGRPPAVGIFVVFVTAMSTGALGTLLALSPQAWYPAYHGTPHLSALADQQLGGVVMLAAGIPVHLAFLTRLFFEMLQVEERRAASGPLDALLPR